MENDTHISTESFIADTESFSLSNTYKVVEAISVSEHGYCEVYKVVRGGRWFAAKCLKKEFRGNPVLRPLLVKEYETGFRLSHMHVCQTFDLVELPELGTAIIMEYVEGKTLRDILHHEKLDKERVSQIARQLAEALAYIHQRQLIHRDIKPENIIITGNGGCVKLIDFGYSDAGDAAIFKQPAGTPRYAAPENFLVNGEATPQSDIYSLGVVIREMVENCRRSSFVMRRIANRCCQESPEKRYQNAREIIGRLDRLQFLQDIHPAIPLALLLMVAIIAFWIFSDRNYTVPTNTTTLSPTESITDMEKEKDLPLASQQNDVNGESPSQPEKQIQPQLPIPPLSIPDHKSIEGPVQQPSHESHLSKEDSLQRGLEERLLNARELHTYIVNVRDADPHTYRLLERIWSQKHNSNLFSELGQGDSLFLNIYQYVCDAMTKDWENGFWSDKTYGSIRDFYREQVKQYVCRLLGRDITFSDDEYDYVVLGWAVVNDMMKYLNNHEPA